MYSERAKTLQALFLLLDSTCITVAYALALGLRIFQHRIPILREFPGTDWTHAQVGRPELAVPLLAFLLIWGSYIRRSGLYRNGVSYKASAFIPVYVKGLLFGVLSAAAILFGLKMAISRLLFGYFFILCFVLLLSKQFAFSFLYRRLRSSDSRRRHALVIGSGISAAWFSKVISAAEENGYSLIGLLFPDDAIYADTGGIPLVGTIGDLDRVLVDHPVDEVFIVGSGSEIAEMAPVAETLIHRGRVVSLISTMASSSRGIRGRVTEYAGIPMISYGPMPKDTVQSGTKRLMDVVFASIALVVLSPLLLLIAGAIKVFDPGPVFFQQDRLGHGGKHFKLYKFRSMKKNAENILNANKELYKRYVENDYKLPENEDPRISTLGRLLRKSSLDELPQLWNVLKGEMTLVGPRPIVPAELEKYEPYSELFLSVKPGITGRWQADGRSDVRYPERAFMDIDYIGDHSVMADLEIMLKTVPSVIKGKGAR